VDIYCSFGTNNTGNTGWVFVNKYIWNGAGVGNLASTAGNWVGDVVPLTANPVLFNATGTKNCTWDLTAHYSMMEIATGYSGTITLNASLYLTTNFDQQAGSLVIGTATKITVEGNMSIGSGGTFTAAIPIEVWQNTTFAAAASITVTGADFILNGWAAQNASFGGKTLKSLSVPNTYGVVSLLDSFTATDCTISPAVSVKFGAGKTFTFTNITWDGSLGNLIVLRSTVDGSSWYLVIAGGDVVSYVDVKNSDASGGGLILATDSINRGGNINWDFGAKRGMNSMARFEGRFQGRSLERMLPRT
jgi:hypothetical protein